MRQIQLDAGAWTTRDDFFDALLPRLGSPAWHGRNLDALWDSLRSNDINQVQTPFELVLTNLATCPEELQTYLETFAQMMVAARDEGVVVTLSPGEGS